MSQSGGAARRLLVGSVVLGLAAAGAIGFRSYTKRQGLHATADVSPSSASSETAAFVVPFPTAGVPAALDRIYFEAERRATAKLPGAVLLVMEVMGSTSRSLDPGAGGRARAMYGLPDVRGVVRKGAEVVVVSFGSSGLSEALAERAERDFHTVGYGECLPEEARAAFDPKVADFALRWDAARGRPLWVGQVGAASAVTLSTDTCAIVGPASKH